jgi:hypothetical protein
VKRIIRYLPLLLCIPFANAQSSFDLNIGFGTQHDKSSGQGIDNINSTNAFGPCVPGSGDVYCAKTPALNGFFLGFGGAVMATKKYGFGADVMFTPAKSDYAGLQYRQTFYDVDGIYAPINQKKVILQIKGGIGGARTGFSYTQSSCVGTAICTSQTQPVGNANHFALNAGVGVQLFVTEHIFIRPEFNFHYVPNLTQQFGSDVVPGGMVWIGYSLGDR